MDKVLLLSDSNGRHMSLLLQDSLQGQYSVFSFIKPNAKLKDVVGSVDDLARDFSRRDYILVIGGTNDVNGENNYKNSFTKAVDILMPITSKTNLLLTEIPKNYFLKMYRIIRDANKFIGNIIEMRQKHFENDVGFIKLDKLFRRADFTRHGLHMNLRGKTKLAMAIASFIWDLKIAKCERLLFGKFLVARCYSEDVSRNSKRRNKFRRKVLIETNVTIKLQNGLLVNAPYSQVNELANHKVILDYGNKFNNEAGEIYKSTIVRESTINVCKTVQVVDNKVVPRDEIQKCKNDNVELKDSGLNNIFIDKLDIYTPCVNIYAIKEVLDKIGSLCIKSSKDETIKEEKLIINHKNSSKQRKSKRRYESTRNVQSTKTISIDRTVIRDSSGCDYIKSVYHENEKITVISNETSTFSENLTKIEIHEKNNEVQIMAKCDEFVCTMLQDVLDILDIVEDILNCCDIDIVPLIESDSFHKSNQTYSDGTDKKLCSVIENTNEENKNIESIMNIHCIIQSDGSGLEFKRLWEYLN